MPLPCFLVPGSLVESRCGQAVPCIAVDHAACDGSEVREVLGCPFHHPQDSLAQQSLPVRAKQDRFASGCRLGKLRQGELGEAEPRACAHPCSIPVPHQDETPAPTTLLPPAVEGNHCHLSWVPKQQKQSLVYPAKHRPTWLHRDMQRGSFLFSLAPVDVFLCNILHGSVKRWQKPSCSAGPCLFGP